MQILKTKHQNKLWKIIKINKMECQIQKENKKIVI
jgi:hypothetical protein